MTYKYLHGDIWTDAAVFEKVTMWNNEYWLLSLLLVQLSTEASSKRQMGKGKIKSSGKVNDVAESYERICLQSFDHLSDSPFPEIMAPKGFSYFVNMTSQPSPIITRVQILEVKCRG